MEEEWRDIKGYEGLYQVSNWGRVKSLARVDSLGRRVNERILRPFKNRCGYLKVSFSKEGKRKIHSIHRLVLMTFNPIENIENLEVNHLDENKENNMIENLEWCTRIYNNNYGTRNDRVGEKLKGRTFSEVTKRKLSKSLKGRTLSEEHKIKLGIPIVQIDSSTNKVVNVWGSSKDAERGGYNQGNINECCRGKRKSHGGYKWQYLSYYISQIDPRIKKVILFDKEYYVN